MVDVWRAEGIDALGGMGAERPRPSAEKKNDEIEWIPLPPPVMRATFFEAMLSLSCVTLVHKPLLRAWKKMNNCIKSVQAINDRVLAAAQSLQIALPHVHQPIACQRCSLRPNLGKSSPPHWLRLWSENMNRCKTTWAYG